MFPHKWPRPGRREHPGGQQETMDSSIPYSERDAGLVRPQNRIRRNAKDENLRLFVPGKSPSVAPSGESPQNSGGMNLSRVNAGATLSKRSVVSVVSTRWNQANGQNRLRRRAVRIGGAARRLEGGPQLFPHPAAEQADHPAYPCPATYDSATYGNTPGTKPGRAAGGPRSGR